LTTIDHAGAIIPLESEMVPGGSWTNNFDVSGLFSSELGAGSVQMNVVENAAATGYESVSTPYMEFKTALRVESEGTIDMNTVIGEISTGLVTIEVNSTNWFVQGVGLVRQEGESEGLSSVMVLVAIDN
jgi:hypothetical protein